MEIYTTSQARKNLFKLVNYTTISHEPVYIVGKKHKAVLLSKEDYSALIETLYIASVPGMTESIIKSSKEPIKSFSEQLEWNDEG